MQLQHRYGTALPEDHLVLMFQNILPDDVLEDVKLQRDMKDSLKRQVAHVLGEIGTYTDAQLSKWNISKLQKSLNTKAKMPTSISTVAVEQESPKNGQPHRRPCLT